MNKRIKSIILCCMLLACIGLQPLVPEQIAHAKSVSQLQMEKRTKQQKLKDIQRLKSQIVAKERYVNANLIKNQQRLDTTRHSLNTQIELLERKKSELSTLESDLTSAIDEKDRIAAEVGQRLKSYYMEERLGMLEMLISAGDLTTLLDRIYYKKRIFKHDKQLFAEFQLRVQILDEKKKQVAEQKARLADTIQSIQTYQSQLQEAMVVDKLLLNKLRTSRRAYEMAQEQLLRESNAIERQIQQLTGQIRYVGGSTGRFLRPVLANITSGFGYRFHPIHRTTKLHTGTDFGAGTGTPIRATDGGVVIFAGWRGGYGKVVIINHGSHNGKNITSLYGHMSSISVSSGQRVSPGQTIGRVGTTGLSTGPHLHFEIRENGRPVNPMGYVR